MDGAPAHLTESDFCSRTLVLVCMPRLPEYHSYGIDAAH